MEIEYRYEDKHITCGYPFWTYRQIQAIGEGVMINRTGFVELDGTDVRFKERNMIAMDFDAKYYRDLQAIPQISKPELQFHLITAKYKR